MNNHKRNNMEKKEMETTEWNDEQEKSSFPMIENPVVNERGELVVEDFSVLGDYASQEEAEAVFRKYIKEEDQ